MPDAEHSEIPLLAFDGNPPSHTGAACSGVQVGLPGALSVVAQSHRASVSCEQLVWAALPKVTGSSPVYTVALTQRGSYLTQREASQFGAEQ